MAARVAPRSFTNRTFGQFNTFERLLALILHGRFVVVTCPATTGPGTPKHAARMFDCSWARKEDKIDSRESCPRLGKTSVRQISGRVSLASQRVSLQLVPPMSPANMDSLVSDLCTFMVESRIGARWYLICLN